MIRIGLISDTHGWTDARLLHHLEGCGEIWHAGDIGSFEVTEKLAAIAPLRAVHGNIDGTDLRREFPQHLHFYCESLKVFITHIGGHPGKYSPQALQQINLHRPQLFVCGHSHILKVMSDKALGIMHINPGAAGIYGFHQVRTLIRFTVSGDRMHDLEIVELGKRSSAQPVGTFD